MSYSPWQAYMVANTYESWYKCTELDIINAVDHFLVEKNVFANEHGPVRRVRFGRMELVPRLSVPAIMGLDHLDSGVITLYLQKHYSEYWVITQEDYEWVMTANDYQ